VQASEAVEQVSVQVSGAVEIALAAVEQVSGTAVAVALGEVEQLSAEAGAAAWAAEVQD
jgi:hypothetical protein